MSEIVILIAVSVVCLMLYITIYIIVNKIEIIDSKLRIVLDSIYNVKDMLRLLAERCDKHSKTCKCEDQDLNRVK